MTRSDWLLAAPETPSSGKANTQLHKYLVHLMRGSDLPFDEAQSFFAALADPDANSAQISGALIALAAKGETAAELAGMAKAMQTLSLKVTSRQKNFVDIGGTGRSTAKTFNVSTAAAIVAAGAGLTVAKQANRAGMSRTGSADALDKLGIKVSVDQPKAQTCLSGVGLSFMFAPNFHPALRRIADVRRNLGVRTCLNLIGPLSNPARAPRRLIGVWHPSLIKPMAEALAMLGTEQAWVVHGSDGLDEMTVSGKTFVGEVTGKNVRAFKIGPEDFKLPVGTTQGLQASSPEQSAKIILEILQSKRRDDARNLVVINAAAALVVGGLARDPMHAARMAEQSIDSGQAQNKLERLIQTTNK